MERRTFVAATVGSLCAAGTVLGADPKSEAPELFELRTYTIKPAKLPLLEDYLAKAFIPTLRRLGVGPVGAFSDVAEKDLRRVFVLIVHKNADSVTSWHAKLAA